MIQWRHLLTLAALCASAFFLASPARADTRCQATSPTVLAFGPTSATQTTDAYTTFTVRCTTTALSALGNTKVRLCLGLGAGSTGGGVMSPRQMTEPNGQLLRYQLYQDPARSQAWGALGTPSLSAAMILDFDYPVPLITGGALSQTVAIYGRVPGGQALAAGNYSSKFSGLDTVMTYAANTTLLGSATQPSNCDQAGAITVNDAFPFVATSSVPAQCYAYSTTDLDFGSVPGVITAHVDQSSTIGLTCTLNTAWQLGLSKGLNAQDNTRRMRQPGTTEYVNYELYRDPGRSQRWGSNLETDTLKSTGTGTPQTMAVYGRVPSGQAAMPGNYTDTITVTITY